MKLAISVLAFLFIVVGLIFVSRATLSEASAIRVLDSIVDEGASIRKTCVAGAGALAIVKHKLEHGDAGADEAARDLLAYGLPWLDLCATRRADPLPADLLTEIQALYADVDRWRQGDAR